MRIEQGRPVSVVGAGLVGSLLSLYLSRRGFRVEVYEKRPDMRVEVVDRGKSINLAISARGLAALARVGLEAEARHNAIPMRGRMIHPVRGELQLQPYGKDDSQQINSISRGWLNRMLMTAAEAEGRVRIHFRQQLGALDLDHGELELGGGARRATQVIFGTDGSGSAVREAMAGREGFTVSQELLAHGYKELTLPAGPGGSFRLERNALHIWPRGSYMLIALPNLEGSFTCTLFLPFKGPVSFESLDSPSRVLGFFAEQFPDALPLIPELAQDFFANPTGVMGTVKCAPWNAGGRAVLLGDAAHAIVPFFGQGMNCGFEDCVVMDGLLGRAGSWEEAFETFFRERKPNADAIADMAVENFVEMRDRTADGRFLLEKGVERILLNAFPGEFFSRYALVSFSLVPYRYAYEVGQIATGIVSELAEGLDRPEEVDLPRAAALIRDRLLPFIKEQGHGSGASG